MTGSRIPGGPCKDFQDMLSVFTGYDAKDIHVQAGYNGNAHSDWLARCNVVKHGHKVRVIT